MTYFEQLAATLARLDHAQLDALFRFVVATESTLWVCGNGGSMSTAQHWACDLSKASARRVQVLGCNAAVLTAWANDESYTSALARELERLALPGDRMICLSCSGQSGNIITALRMAGTLKLSRAIVTGADAPIDWTLCELAVTAPSTHYGIIEDCHLAIGHWLTERVRNDR